MYYPTKIGAGLNANINGAGTLYGTVEMPSGKIYAFFINSINSDPSYCYSVNYGKTWSSPVVFKACTCTNMAVWYDRWSGIDADLVHVVYTDSGTDDTFYRTLNLADDTLGTERTVFAGATAANGGALSVTRARGGNVMVATCIDAGAEYDTRKTSDLGENWTSTTTDAFEGATQDQIILLPGWNLDNQDVMAIFWDADADEISVKRYDDSADTWTETSIATGMVDQPANTTTLFPNFSAVVDLNNSRNILVAWTAPDAANADLLCWWINDTTITAKTDVVTNSSDDQGLCALSILGNDLYAFYVGSSDGTQIYYYGVDIFYKKSTDYGATWSNETLFYPTQNPFGSIFASMIAYKNICLTSYPYLNGGVIHFFAKYISSKATYQLGI